MINKTYYLKVKVLTPVHIGVEDGELRKYEDFLDLGEQVTVLDKKKMFALSRETRDAISNLDTRDQHYTREFDKLLRNSNKKIELKDVIHRNLQYSYLDNKFKQTYWANHLSPAIPGSSLKGAIRSILLNFLSPHEKPSSPEEPIFGNPENSSMKNLIIGDTLFMKNSTQVIPEVVFGVSSKYNNYGEWKYFYKRGHWIRTFALSYENAGRNKIGELSPIEFISNYESISSGCEGVVKINIKSNDKNHFSSKIFNNGIIGLLRIIHNYTNQSIKKELQYYKNYHNTNLKWQTEKDEEVWNYILRKNQENGAVIRVGRGGGFHNVTGDSTPFSIDHLPDWNRKNPKTNKEEPLKSRKLVFSFNDQSSNEPSFSPMGFLHLSLCSKEDYTKLLLA